MKLSIISEGGGMRGAYALGAIAALYSHFGLKKADYVTGSSGGIGILAYYTAGQFYPGYHIWTRELPNLRFFSWRNVLTSWAFVDVNRIVEDIFRKRTPLNEKKLRESKIRLIIPVTDAETGEVKYFDNRSDYNFLDILKAAMAMPFAYGKTVNIGGFHYFDGTSSDPLPVDFPGISESRKIIILTKTAKDALGWDIQKPLSSLMKWRLKPGVYKALQNSQSIYRKRMRDVEELSANGDIIIRPDRRMSRFDNRVKTIRRNITSGYQDVISNSRIINLVSALKSGKNSSFYFN